MPNALREAGADTLHWVLAWAKHVAETTAAVWQWTTWPEVVCESLLSVTLAVQLIGVIVTGEGWLAATALLTIAVLLSFLRAQVALARERWQLEEELRQSPTGAPRIHDVQCRCDRRSRWVYNGDTWVDLGPARAFVTREST